MKNSTKTTWMTSILSVISIITIFFVQLRQQDKLTLKCSYLDPFLIDVFALSGGLFLVIEGIYKMVKEKDINPKMQITRALRITLGISILTIHIMQVLYK